MCPPMLRWLLLLLFLLRVCPAYSDVLGIVLIGPPGAGKGTQASFLRERYHLRPLSPGEILRAEVRSGSELGKLAASYMERGLLLPNEITMKVVAQALDRLGPGEGFLLDGFPRAREACESLDALLQSRHIPLAAVIQLDVPDDVVLARLTQRRLCPECQRTYHLTDNPPKQDGVCDYDHGRLELRPDDLPPVVLKRLQIYHQNSDPVLDYYRAKNLLHTIQASQSIEGVRDEMTRLLDAQVAQPR